MAWIIGLLSLILVVLAYISYQLFLAVSWLASMRDQLLLLRVEFGHALGTSLGDRCKAGYSHLYFIQKLLIRGQADTDMILSEQRFAREAYKADLQIDHDEFQKTLAEMRKLYPARRAYREAKEAHRKIYE